MSPCLKQLFESNIQPVLNYHGDHSCEPELVFIHTYFGEIQFPDMSQYAIEQLIDELVQIKQKKIEARNDDSTFENNRVG